MIKSIRLIFLAVIFFISYSCKKDLQDDAQYKRPDWLAGKLYTQIEAHPELSTFARCIKLVGFDSLINISGTYTVFAPDNNAFALYFQNHPEFNDSVDLIPKEELLRIVKYHIIKDPWSLEQLKQLDVNGWIDPTDENYDEPKGFKRETLLRDKDIKYGISRIIGGLQIVDTSQTKWHRRHATDGNKFASIFYKEILDIYNLKSDDYQFYFNRPFENPNDVYYMEGRIIKANVFAENGFVHIIDRVTLPLQNAYEILNTKKGNVSYSKFLDLINTFPSISFNKTKTNEQPGVNEGLVVDSLFDINYYDLAFDIINEQTKAPSGTTGSIGYATIRYHNGLVAPTNEAFDAFVNEYLVGSGKWGSLQNAPKFIRKIFVNSCMSVSPIYPKSFQTGYKNGEKDFMKLDKSTIIQQQYGSNCSFIGVNKAVVPRAFISVAGPIYLNRGYSFAMYAIEEAGLLDALKKENSNYSLFVESDENCKVDSSFVRSAVFVGENEYSKFEVFQKAGNLWLKFNPLTDADLRTLFLNHIGTDIPKGIARKEFIKNLAGNYIVVNNVTGEVSGTAPTKFGYNGSLPVQVTPTQISTNADNGKTYAISNWLSFSAPLLYSKMSNPAGNQSKFHALLVKAGLAVNSQYTFLSDNEFYTVFAPTNAALNNYNADTIALAGGRLKKFLMMHFVQGSMIFTDGSSLSKYYETARIDEKSTPYTTIFTKIYIEPGTDVIQIKDKLGSNYLTVNESAVTNMITGRTIITTGTPPFTDYLSTAVIHEIDKVLLFDDLDTK